MRYLSPFSDCVLTVMARHSHRHSFRERVPSRAKDTCQKASRVKKAGVILQSVSPDGEACLALVLGNTGKEGFAKGTQQAGETPGDCALREAYEETGLQLDNFGDVKPVSIDNVLYFTVSIAYDVVFEPVDKNEILDCRWFTLTEIKQLILKGLCNRGVKLYIANLDRGDQVDGECRVRPPKLRRCLKRQN